MAPPRLVALVAALAIVATGCETAEPQSGRDADPNASTAHEPTAGEATVSAERLRAHLAALQRIADAHGGTRATGTPGYDASVRYVAETLREHGLDPTLHRFRTAVFRELAPPRLEPLGAADLPRIEDDDVVSMQYSAGGRVDGSVVPVDLRLPPGPPDSTTSGCDDVDFEGFPRGAIALVQRGGCFYFEKVGNAQAAGAAATLVMNEGQPGRRKALAGTLLDRGVEIPALAISFELGAALARASERGGVRVRIAARAEVEEETVVNVLAEGDPGVGRVVLLGGHLDSVSTGPGLNDNGSGVAALLELARVLGGSDDAPAPGVRFGFWGAEELGLRGSQAYVADLGPDERARILAVVNLDVVGSRNAVPFVYDGDGSGGGERGPEGSAELERLLREELERSGATPAQTPLVPNSDHAPFLQAGIAVGGVFSGADGLKTDAEARRHGGDAGEPYDPCYHRACDTLEGVDVAVLEATTRGVAGAVRRLLADQG